MEENKTTTAEKPRKPKEATVDLFIPRATGKEEPNELISINGKNWVLPKGKTSQVPPYVKAEYDRAVRAKEKYEETRERLLEASK